MKILKSIIGGVVLVVGLAAGAQTSQTVVLPNLVLPPVKIAIGGQTVSIAQPAVPLPAFTVQFPKQVPSTNWVTMTNWVNVTNWSAYSVTNYQFVQITNVTPVFITNTLPNYIPSLIVTSRMVFTDVSVANWATNKPPQ